MTFKNQTLKVVELGLQDRVYEEMKKSDFSAGKLATKLKEEGYAISQPSISKFIRNTKEAQKELIKKDLNMASEIKSLTTEYTRALKDILKEVEEVKNTAKDEKDYVTYNQLIGRLMQGIELIAKISGELNPNKNTKIDVKYIYNEINMKLEKDMKEANDAFNSDVVIDIDAEIEQQIL
jgi:hypothetical protein